jgi:hypothetical protein
VTGRPCRRSSLTSPGHEAPGRAGQLWMRSYYCPGDSSATSIRPSAAVMRGYRLSCQTSEYHGRLPVPFALGN